MVKTSDRILEVAEANFARRGYDATALADIAAEVGIRTPSLYKHFESKHALYEAVLDRLLSPFFQLLGELLTAPGDAEHAARNMRLVATHFMNTPNLARLVQHAALAGGDELALIADRWYAPLFERAAALTPGQPARAIVMAVHAMLSGYVTLAPLHARLTGADPLDEHTILQQLSLMGRLAGELWKGGSDA